MNGHDTSVAAIDGGPDWTPPDSTSGVTVSGSPSTYSTGDNVSLDSTVPSGTPEAVFQSELYGDQQWDFDVTAGQSYEVRLYFAEIFQTSSGDRVFDVAIEGDQVINDYDIYADVGHDVGTMQSFTVTPSDGTLDVDFTTEVDNAKVSAIEIVPSEPQPDELGASPSSVDFGTVVVNNSSTETVTLTNLGNASNTSHPDITVDGASITGTDPGQFSHDFSGSVTLAPEESTTINVTYEPNEAQAHAATLEVSHSGTNSPVTVDLTGDGSSSVPVGFGKSTLQGFSAGNPTAVDFGPGGRVYVSTQGGTVYALNVTRNGENSYSVTNEVQIDAIKDIPNHDDNGTFTSSETNRQITGLTAGGTASQPVVYVSSSDPEIDVGQDDDDTDTNSGAISRLTITPGSDDVVQSGEISHTVMVLGLPRSEENHATNGLDLSPDGDTLYVAQGGHTNKGAPGDNFGHTPEYALSAAVLEIDLAQIEANYSAKNLQNYNSNYQDLDFLYAIPTVQNDDATDGDDLPFGGDDGLNQAKIVPNGPVQVHSPGYRNPYDLVLTEDGQVYVIDNGPNGGWGGQPADSSGNIVESDCTNHPNEDGSYGTGDQLHLATEGAYGGHATPIRANPDGAGLYDANGNQYHDFTSSDTPVPFSMANPVECDYQDPSEDNSIGPTFGPTGGITEYTASNFGGEMEGDLLVMELSGTVNRVQLNASGTGVTDVNSPLNTDGGLGLEAQGDSGEFPGTVWSANHGGNDVTVFEPNDYGDSTGDTCSGLDDPTLDEDGDGYDNADEIDAGSDPCSSASTPPDFDDDGTSNVNDPDDDNDGIPDTEDLFAVDSLNGIDTNLPETYDFAPNSDADTILDLGFGGVMMNESNYQQLYDPTEVTAGGAANVLTVENVSQGDAHASTDTQEHGYQVGVVADEPFTVETTVNGLPSDAEPFQSQGVFVGTGDQDNYVKFTATGFSSTGDSGVQLAKEEAGSFTDVANPAAPTAGNATTLTMTVYPSNGTVEGYYTVESGTQQFAGQTTVPTSWFDTADGNGTAVGVIATSNGASSTFDSTWQYLAVEPLQTDGTTLDADAGADQTVDEGTTVTLDATGSTGDNLTYSWTQTAGPSVTLNDSTAATPSFTAPDVDGDQTLTFEVSVSNGTASDTDAVNVTVQDTDAGDVVFAVNSGGSEYTATDGTVYVADTNFVNGSTYSVPSDTEIGNTTDDTLYRTERYGDPFGYDVPVANGTYQVTLKFAEIYQGVSDSDTVDSTGPDDGTNENDRLFNASVEGQQVLTNYDIYADVGPLNATQRTYTAEVNDGSLDVDFEATYDNAKVSAIRVENVTQEMTLEKAVATTDESGNDSVIELTEIQTAINWWQEEEEVPGTGGETIELTEMQDLINLWQTEATITAENEAPTASLSVTPQDPEVGEQVTLDASGSTDPEGDALNYSWTVDGQSVADDAATIQYTFQTTGDHSVEVTVEDTAGNVDTATQTVTVSEATTANGSTQVLVTPNSGLEASTFNGGSFQVTNTGEKNISSVAFDLDSTSLPDMVFDPDGTAGDQAGKGLQIDSESGDGVGVVSTADADVFSQPHNGVNGSDGYDVLTIEFTDFEPGETVTFSADNDPTSIKNATITSQEAGPVSGLELARATVTVGYDDGTTQTTQTVGDGSQGGAEAVADPSVPAAPSIGIQGLTLDSGALDAQHGAATVTDANQTVTVTGPPGATVTLVQVEAELELDNVPDYNGTPGYEIEDYEANKAENVAYYTATVGSDGTVDVPVTLTNSTDVGGYNYFVAAVEDDAGAGMASNVAVLKLEAGSDTGTTDQPLYAVNAGGGAYTAVDGTEYSADANFDQFDGTSSTDLAIGNTEDDPLYQTERYGDPLSYSFPVSDGTYNVTLQFAEIWHTSQTGGAGDDDGGGDGEVGDRVFNVSLEGQQVLTNYDIYAEVGGLNATDKTYTVEVTDGSLDVVMDASEDFAKVSAIRIENASTDSGTNTAPTVDAIADRTVVSGENVDVPVSASDADADTLSLSVSGPDFVELADDGDGTGTLTIEPGSADAGTYTVTVTADDGQTTASESFNLTVETATSVTTGEVVHRVDAGNGTTTSAIDGGPDWVGVTGTGSPLLLTHGGGTYCAGDDITPTSAVPSSTPDVVYDCELYGPMEWSLPVTAGQEVEVRLYLGNQFPQASQEGQRQYNVSIEGTQVLTEYDPVADVGHANGTVKAFTATDEDGDGNVTVTFEVGTIENPQVNAIEVVNTSDSGSSGSGSASIGVTSNAGIDASTFSGGSFEVTNTGEKNLQSVSFDLSESLVPDAVFDPNGTAGDSTAKGLEINSESGDGVGVVSTNTTDVFSQPHDGNSDDGYDVLTVEFTDFEPGETVAFSTDVDPTTIKGASTTGGAGAVSGLELAGSATTVQYADGTTQTDDLFGDGSSGGAAATTDGSVPPAPTIGVQSIDGPGDPDFQSTDFPNHQAATVGNATQTVTLGGGPGETVQLLHVVASEPPSDGYDLDAYEADNAESVSYQSVTLDGSGEGTATVTLNESNLNYLVAATESDDGTLGETSTTLILNYTESTSTSTQQVAYRVNAGGSSLTAVEDGPDWSADNSSSTSQYLVAGGATAGGYSPSSVDSSVPSSTPTELFQTERYDPETSPEMQWEFPAQSGATYEVRLYFCDCYSGTSSTGDRVFNVSIDGQQVLTNYDIIADVGDDTAVMKNFTVTSDGTIDVDFEHVTQNPQVSGIEIVNKSA